MGAGDPYPMSDRATIQVTKEFAADFLLNWMDKPISKRPVLRMVLRGPDGTEFLAGNWQVLSVASLRREAGHDTPMAIMRAVSD